MSSFQLKSPGKHSRRNNGNRCNRRCKLVVIRRRNQSRVRSPLSEQLKNHGSQAEANRKVHQHNMLRMLCEQYRSRIKRVFHHGRAY
jgi:hypothetical protein